jgi:subtilisin family serine protease
MFGIKANNALSAGAVVMLVANNHPIIADDGLDSDYAVNIVSGMLSQNDANRFRPHLDQIRLTLPVPFVSEISGQNTLSDFSSRGPTLDGRIKPDVLAPGESITSALTDKNLQSFQCDTLASCTTSMEGTSMATPVAAGSAALVRSYFAQGFWRPPPTTENAAPEARPINPTGALVKAVMVNSAVDELFLGERPPSFNQGFGRIKLDNVLVFPDSARRLLVGDSRPPDLLQ